MDERNPHQHLRMHPEERCTEWREGDVAFIIGKTITEGERGTDYPKCPKCWPKGANKHLEVSPDQCPTPQYHKTHTYCPNCSWTDGQGKVRFCTYESPLPRSPKDMPLVGDWSKEPGMSMRWWDMAKAMGADHEVEHSRTFTRWVRHTLELDGRFVVWELTSEELASETLEAQEGRLNKHARILIEHVYGVQVDPANELYTFGQLQADCRIKCTAVRIVDPCGPSVRWRCNHPGHLCGGIMLEKSWKGECPKCYAPVALMDHIGP